MLEKIGELEVAQIITSSDQYSVFWEPALQNCFGGVEYFGICVKSKLRLIFPRPTQNFFSQFNSLAFLSHPPNDNRIYFELVRQFLDTFESREWNFFGKVSLHRSIWDIRPMMWHSPSQFSLVAKYSCEYTNIDSSGQALLSICDGDKGLLEKAWLLNFKKYGEQERFQKVLSSLHCYEHFKIVSLQSNEGEVHAGILSSDIEKRDYLMFFASSDQRNSDLNRLALNTLKCESFKKGHVFDLLDSNSIGTAYWKRGMRASSYLYFGLA